VLVNSSREVIVLVSTCLLLFRFSGESTSPKLPYAYIAWSCPVGFYVAAAYEDDEYNA